MPIKATFQARAATAVERPTKGSSHRNVSTGNHSLSGSTRLENGTAYGQATRKNSAR